LHVFVINLARSPDRLESFQAANSLAEWSVARAIDGLSLDIADLERRGLLSADIVHPDYYSIGGVGLALSHVALWDVAITSGETVTIAEDDAIFHPSFDALAPGVLQSLPEDADVILWGFNFDLFLSFEMLPGVSSCLAQFEEQRMREAVTDFQSRPIDPRPFPLKWAFGTICYSVTPKGAMALREACVPLRPMVFPCPEGVRAPPFMEYYRTVGIDNTMCGAYRRLKAYVCFPPLVVTKNETHRSTVQPRRGEP